MTLALRAAARTDVGLRRSNNEDAMYVGRRLVAIADGMGGQAYGEVASRVAILTAARLDNDSQPGDPLTELRDAIGDANEQLRTLIAGDDSYDGMGTTFTALLSSRGRIAIAHVGDSRAYLLRDGEIRQISHDHSLVQGLVDAGHITIEEAEQHPSRSVITRALDGHNDVDPDLGMLEARVGDRYLLCSDGLSDVVSAETMAQALRAPERDEACERLIQLALRAGGPDNVTVVVADVVDDSDGSPPTETVIGGSADEDHAGGDGDRRGTGATAAERAADLSGPPAESSSPRLRVPTGPGKRVALVIAGAAVLAGAAVIGIWLYTGHQYYVGTVGAPQAVGIFQGVPGGVLGVDLSHLHNSTDVPVGSLPEDDRNRVQGGITASSLRNAQQIVIQLRSDGCTQVEAAQQAAAAARARAIRRRHPHRHLRPAAITPPAWCTG